MDVSEELLMNVWRRIRSGLEILQPQQLSVRLGRCPFCGPTVLLRLSSDETGVRCVRCAASVVHLSIGWALRECIGSTVGLDACELSSRSPLVTWLRGETRSLALSEFFDDLAPGTQRDGIRCEDVQRLTYANATFDLIMHTEVFEHVPDDLVGFRELYRVLRSGGHMLFSVPLTNLTSTVERAHLDSNGVQYLLPPAYHDDLLRGVGKVLVFRDYGADILQRIEMAGFLGARIMPRDPRVPWNHGRNVIHARKR